MSSPSPSPSSALTTCTTATAGSAGGASTSTGAGGAGGAPAAVPGQPLGAVGRIRYAVAVSAASSSFDAGRRALDTVPVVLNTARAVVDVFDTPKRAANRPRKRSSACQRRARDKQNGRVSSTASMPTTQLKASKGAHIATVRLLDDAANQSRDMTSVKTAAGNRAALHAKTPPLH
jgi:hypothetical protein